LAVALGLVPLALLVAAIRTSAISVIWALAICWMFTLVGVFALLCTMAEGPSRRTPEER
jgi:hypothetical protein